METVAVGRMLPEAPPALPACGGGIVAADRMLPEAPPALPASGGGIVAASTINIFNFWKDFLCRKNFANSLKKLLGSRCAELAASYFELPGR